MEQKKGKTGSQEKRGRCTEGLECAVVWIISLISYLWMSLERGQRWRERSFFVWAAGKKWVYLKNLVTKKYQITAGGHLFILNRVFTVIVTVALKPVAFSPARGGCQIIKAHLSLIIVHLFLSADIWHVVECFM